MRVPLTSTDIEANATLSNGLQPVVRVIPERHTTSGMLRAQEGT